MFVCLVFLFDIIYQGVKSFRTYNTKYGLRNEFYEQIKKILKFEMENISHDIFLKEHFFKGSLLLERLCTRFDLFSCKLVLYQTHRDEKLKRCIADETGSVHVELAIEKGKNNSTPPTHL